MPALRFDRRWIALLIIIVVLANTRSLPWPLTALALAIPAGWLLYQAAQTLGIDLPGTRSSTRVTYWRGRRIETSGPPRRFIVNRANLVPGLLYGVFGLALALAALAVVTRNLGV
ncbi:MAG: hypothetical protein C0184_08395 [Chloroflexus aggregans]|uniref:Uncharacterized protein n=1 Tax=Chloroflexus aggregans TaxID=152260 RepID=A0A2J6X4I1_9CHLR|nr:MAG: hypothetical protein C0184_08395 [Chloroflexus aggregans]